MHCHHTHTICSLNDHMVSNRFIFSLPPRKNAFSHHIRIDIFVLFFVGHLSSRVIGSQVPFMAGNMSVNNRQKNNSLSLAIMTPFSPSDTLLTHTALRGKSGSFTDGCSGNMIKPAGVSGLSDSRIQIRLSSSLTFLNSLYNFVCFLKYSKACFDCF